MGSAPCTSHSQCWTSPPRLAEFVLYRQSWSRLDPTGSSAARRAKQSARRKPEPEPVGFNPRLSSPSASLPPSLVCLPAPFPLPTSSSSFHAGRVRPLIPLPLHSLPSRFFSWLSFRFLLSAASNYTLNRPSVAPSINLPTLSPLSRYRVPSLRSVRTVRTSTLIATGGSLTTSALPSLQK
ncbi:hypothetical protein BO94DRAFT_315667 [Aspergillus sclerotioniger CBS 115572]|uniref:Uncharacterized protein n=1 Tax=Aspergillus sclerotioniger CBS 115572 TaxID=1450535 RepID=A0A317XBP0_9EURO|nr:hypothetical protein BO94DRAFT_315667 [Aspergillus sclerotioniger CBS 115572]PWY93970.1 hypothetical protein BO94DRAFT_315667 [Aspergillus sclerotioniger CBS 115572]